MDSCIPHRGIGSHDFLPFLTCEAHVRCYILRVGVSFCMLFFFSVLFQRVVLLLIQSTRWQQNALKYLLDCHHSLYPFITPWLCSHSQKNILLLLLHSCLPVWWPHSPPASLLQLSEDHSLSLNHKDHTAGKMMYCTRDFRSDFSMLPYQASLSCQFHTLHFRKRCETAGKKKSRNHVSGQNP